MDEKKRVYTVVFLIILGIFLIYPGIWIYMHFFYPFKLSGYTALEFINRSGDMIDRVEIDYNGKLYSIHTLARNERVILLLNYNGEGIKFNIYVDDEVFTSTGHYVYGLPHSLQTMTVIKDYEVQSSNNHHPKSYFTLFEAMIDHQIYLSRLK